MLENSVVQMTTGKLIGTTILPNSILLITGIILWRFWRNKQTQLQAQTNELNDEVNYIKEQIADIQTAKNESQLNTVSSFSGENTNSKQIGLFEFLIEDNIKLRKHS